MKHLEILKSPVEPGHNNCNLAGEPIINQTSRIKGIPVIFQDEKEYTELDKEQLNYLVQAWPPVASGFSGGHFFGTSTIYFGIVGKEYFMTKGHFHP